jgi:hypothetical protein
LNHIARMIGVTLGEWYALTGETYEVPTGAIRTEYYCPEIGGYMRCRYRLADDIADIYGHPYLVAYLDRCHVDESLGHIHFYRWTTQGNAILLIGDEQNNDYGFASMGLLKKAFEFVNKAQDCWCRNYHNVDQTPEREVPVDHANLGDLIKAVSKNAS